MSLYYNKTDRSTVKRRAGRARYDRETVDAILAEGLVGHLGIQSDGQPFVIPVLYAPAPDEDRIYVHGSPLSRLVGTLAGGAPMCLTVTLLDGIVLARSAFHHSLNYRSVVVLGDGRVLADADQKQAALGAIVEHVVPGRFQEARPPSPSELAATEVVALSIREASAKVRTGPPVDSAADYGISVWAGELPLSLRAGVPVPDSRCSVELPAYLSWNQGTQASA